MPFIQNWDKFEEFKHRLGSCSCEAGGLTATLSSIFHNPAYDEPYKLGDSPDLDAFGEAERHIKAAQAALDRFEESCKFPRM